MSSRFRPDRLGLAARWARAAAGPLAAGAALATGAAFASGAEPVAEPSVASYTVAFQVPGPGGITVREWREHHVIWLEEPWRMRIDNPTDSSVVIVSGDTTRVFRDGRWSDDPEIQRLSREQAREAAWLFRLPGLAPSVSRSARDRAAKAGQPPRLVVGYGDSDSATVLFDRAARRAVAVHRYDSRSQSWFLLELEQHRERQGSHWAEHRILYASDATGTRGPVIWRATIEAMDARARVPEAVLRPPGSAAAAPSSASTKPDTP